MAPGMRIGKYVLKAKMARGGMAEVWAATVVGPEGFNIPVAIKFVLDELTGDKQFHRMFENEARIAAELRSASLVSILDFDRAGPETDPAIRGRYYIVMEMIEGRDLSRLSKAIAKNSHLFPTGVVLYIMGELLKGLAHIHGRRKDTKRMNLVHRDVSPGNLLIAYSGEIKLSDFGIARSMQEQMTGGFRGKFRYTAPELLEKGGIPSHLSDQFAAGVVMWELLAGRPLFHGDDAQIIGQIRQGDYPRLGGRVPEPIAAIASKMLARNPDDRYPDTHAALSAVYGAPGYTPDGRTLGEIMQFFFPDGQRWSMALTLPRVLLDRAEAPVTTPSRDPGFPIAMTPSVAIGVDWDLLHAMPTWPEFAGRGTFATLTQEQWNTWWSRRLRRGGASQ